MSALAERPDFIPAKTLMLYLTEACNLRCSYCFVDKKPRVMNLSTAQKAVDYLLDGNVSGARSLVTINFFGGEPFLELDLMERTIAYAKTRSVNAGKEIRFSATTNATVASPRVERIIRDNAMSLLVSADGNAAAAAHRPFVSGRSSYAFVARNLRKLTDWSPHALVRLTFHPHSLDLVGSIQHVLALGAKSVAMAPVQEADWSSHVDALEDAYQSLATWYIDQARECVIPPLAITNLLLHQYHKVKQGMTTRPQRPCGVGTSLISIDPDGNVMPCHRFLYRSHDWIGTVNGPVEPKRREPYWDITSRKVMGCETCIAQPVCGGGCRVVALNAGLGLNDRYEPFCITMRAHARALYRIYETLVQERNKTFLQALFKPVIITGSVNELIAS